MKTGYKEHKSAETLFGSFFSGEAVPAKRFRPSRTAISACVGQGVLNYAR